MPSTDTIPPRLYDKWEIDYSSAKNELLELLPRKEKSRRHILPSKISHDDNTLWRRPSQAQNLYPLRS